MSDTKSEATRSGDVLIDADHDHEEILMAKMMKAKATTTAKPPRTSTGGKQPIPKAPKPKTK